MKTQYVLLITMATGLLTSKVTAQTQEDDPKASFGITAGIMAIQPSSKSYAHDTHPGDSFLPNSGQPGSAGETSIDSFQPFGSVGLRYAHPISAISPKLLWKIEAGGLFGNAETRQKNANDPRADGSSAYVYSRAQFGFYGNVGLQYYIWNDSLYIGGDIGITGLFIDNGWERFGSKQSESTKTEAYFTAGPTIGYVFDKTILVEASAQFGGCTGIGVKLGILF
ncbi:MAG: hypothetical protein WCP09_00670 [Candidatus Taylorbacteria bacterium]